ncbi:MAG: hypothetical protein Q8P48_07410 [Deltaproteobacteria bacterium]|nr:hypothetical protein [Deltaproteobacteria bacterium]
MLIRPVGGSGGGSITVEEIDGSPSIAAVTKIQINNGSVTDMGGGIAKIQIPMSVDGGNYLDTYIVSAMDVDGGAY